MELESRHIKVMRFKNEDILNNLEEVLKKLREYLKDEVALQRNC